MSENGRITLREVTVELLHEYYKNFVRDPDIFMDMSTFTEYKYSYDQIMQRYAMLKSQKGRVDFMIMLEDLPIGEVALKHIDKEKSLIPMDYMDINFWTIIGRMKVDIPSSSILIKKFLALLLFDEPL